MTLHPDSGVIHWHNARITIFSVRTRQNYYASWAWVKAGLFRQSRRSGLPENQRLFVMAEIDLLEHFPVSAGHLRHNVILKDLSVIRFQRP
jgi:hypothetical protein